VVVGPAQEASCTGKLACGTALADECMRPLQRGLVSRLKINLAQAGSDAWHAATTSCAGQFL